MASAQWRSCGRRGLNAVEGFFAILTRCRLKRGVFKGVVNLQAAINRFVVDHNQQSKTLRLDRRSQQNHRRCRARAPGAKVNPLTFGHGSAAVSAECPLSVKQPTGKFDPLPTFLPLFRERQLRGPSHSIRHR
jgi:hypothetical protein